MKSCSSRKLHNLLGQRIEQLQPASLGPADDPSCELLCGPSRSTRILPPKNRLYEFRFWPAGIEHRSQLAGMLLGDVHLDATGVLTEPDLVRQPVQHIANRPAFAALPEEHGEIAPGLHSTGWDRAVESRHKGKHPCSDEHLQ